MIKGLYIPLVVWNYYFGRQQALCSYISDYYKIDFLEPIVYSNLKQSFRLKELSKNKVSRNISVIKRNSVLKKSFIFLIYENFKNLIFVIKNKPKFIVSDNYLTSMLVCLYSKIFKIVFVFDLIDDWYEVEKNIFIKFMWKYIFKKILFNFSTIVTTTSKTQFYKYKEMKINITYIPNGKLNVKKIKLKKETNKIKKIIFVGTLRDWFDFDNLFEAIKKLPNLTLDIYGDGPIKNDLIRKSKKIKNVTLRGGIASNKLDKLLVKSDIGVIPLKNNKLNESVNPIKLYDYWSLGKVVIATPTKELISIADGIVCFASDANEYIKLIQKLNTDLNYRYKLSTLGYEEVLKKYNYEVLGKKYVEIIQKVI